MVTGFESRKPKYVADTVVSPKDSEVYRKSLEVPKEIYIAS